MPEGTHPPLRRGAVAVIVRDGRFLVIRRSQFVTAPGKYCFPGGKIEGSETEAEAVLREIQEELGCRIEPRRCVWRSITPWGVHLAWWLVDLEPKTNVVPHLEEVESMHWMTSAEMRELDDLLESNLRFLDAWDQGEFDLGENC